MLLLHTCTPTPLPDVFKHQAGERSPPDLRPPKLRRPDRKAHPFQTTEYERINLKTRPSDLSARSPLPYLIQPHMLTQGLLPEALLKSYRFYQPGSLSVELEGLHGGPWSVKFFKSQALWSRSSVPSPATSRECQLLSAVHVVRQTEKAIRCKIILRPTTLEETSGIGPF